MTAGRLIGALFVVVLASTARPQAAFQQSTAARGGVVHSDRARAAELASRSEAADAAGHPAEARRLLEEAARAAPDWPELRINLAAARSAAGDYDGAIAAAREALALNPALDGAWFNLGFAQLKSGRAAEAAATLAPYADANAPASVLAALGLARLQLGRAADAAPVLKRAVAEGSRLPEVLLALGDACNATNDAAGATAALTLLKQVARDSAGTALLAGDIADAAQDWSTAAREYARAAAIEPRSERAERSLGMIQYKLRQYDAAALHFRAAIARAPSDIWARYYLALIALESGDPATAAGELQKATTIAPERADVWRDLGRARMDLDQTAAAIDALHRAVALAPDDASAWFQLGRALQRAGRVSESRDALARAQALNEQERRRLQKKVSGGRGGR